MSKPRAKMIRSVSSGLLAGSLFLVPSGTASAGKYWVHHGCTKPECICGIPDQDYQYQPRSASVTAVSRTAVLVKRSTIVAEQAITLAEEVLENRGPEAILAPEAMAGIRQQWPAKDETHAPRTLDTTSHRGPIEELPVPPPARYFYESLPDGSLRRVPNLLVSPSPQLESSRSARLIHVYQLYDPKLDIDFCSISRVALQMHNNGQWVLSLRADQHQRELVEQGYQPRLYVKRNQFVIRLRAYGNFAELPTAAAIQSGKPELVDLPEIKFWVQNGEPRFLRTTGHDDRIRQYFDLLDRVELEFFYR
ncbi:MAG: hypothetical protein J5I93_19225 [Pirellulaceae bacterium]|nr:hypothetical protein [Pirellulaceae bacterium]